jgi:glycosyltransferase involved in cell wall biosynthesis
MKVIQCSVIKNAQSRGVDGGLPTLFSHTKSMVDGYAVGVDDSSTDGSYDIAAKTLEEIGKPFDLYRFKWPHDFSEAFNQPLDRADNLGADFYLRVDEDVRICDTDGIRQMIEERDKDIITLSNHDYVYLPEMIIRKGNRWGGIIYETIDFPKPMVLRNKSMSTKMIIHHDRERSLDPRIHNEMCGMEVKRLYGMIPDANDEGTFRIAHRFSQIGLSRYTDNWSQWLYTAKALYEDSIRSNYEVGDCYYRISIIHSLLGDNEKTDEFLDKAKEQMPETTERILSECDAIKKKHSEKPNAVMLKFVNGFLSLLE